MLNPILFNERAEQDFLRYQLTAYPFADTSLYAQMRQLLNLEETGHQATRRRHQNLSGSEAIGQQATFQFQMPWGFWAEVRAITESMKTSQPAHSSGGSES